MNKEIINNLRSIVGKDWVIENKEVIEGYLYDETAIPVRPKAVEDVVLVKAESSLEISKILRLANKEKISVFVRGGGTGLVGGAIPTKSGILLSLERMKKIEVDKENLMAISEAGATLGDLLKTAEDAGLFFPAHPGDEGAEIGGLIACNAGGSRAVKTGIMRNYVKGLEVVLPTGEILNLGGKLLKNNTGYNLMHIFIGSEGTLGVITKAIIRLYPKFGSYITLIVPFNKRSDAFAVVPKILQSGIIPLAIEYVEKDLVERSARHLGTSWPAKQGDYFLIIIVAESSEEAAYSELEKITDLCSRYTNLEPLIAETRKEQENILKIRSEIYPVLKPESVDILDVTVPPANILRLINKIDMIAKKYDIKIPVYGHVGDGNIHPHIMLVKGWSEKQYKGIVREIYLATKELEGTLTGEHGIGEIRKEYLGLFLSKKELEIMRKLKRLFDPNNILNPGKVV